MALRRNLLLGLAAGVAGTAAMNAYWMAVGKLKPELASTGDEPATQKVARRAFRSAGVKSPSSDAREMGGQAVHWGYGAGWGVAAGASRAAGLPLTWGGGQLFGASLWALGDIWMLYKLGLAKHPSEYPMPTHLASLGAHLAYGLGAWATMETLGPVLASKRRALRRAA